MTSPKLCDHRRGVDDSGHCVKCGECIMPELVEVSEALPKLEFALHCECCQRNKITVEVFGSPGASATARVTEWQPIESAPKDETTILAWCVHDNAKYSKDAIAEGWAGPVVTRWIDFQGGGWTWHGHCGVFTHWMPLPTPPAGQATTLPADRASEAVDNVGWMARQVYAGATAEPAATPPPAPASTIRQEHRELQSLIPPHGADQL